MSADYAPYHSESDSDGYDSETSNTDTSYTSSDTEREQERKQPRVPDTAAFARTLYAAEGARNQRGLGILFPARTAESFVSKSESNEPTIPLPPDAALYKPPEGTAPPDFGTTTFKTSRNPVTSLIMINSRDRDSQVYPQPTQFRIRLPRPYKNIINVQLQQVKLLTSFYYFREDKQNLEIMIQEKDRPYSISTFITEGSYNIGTLIEELKRKLNYVPLFYDWPNGFDDFAAQFVINGDFFLNFNEPGDYWYNTETQQYTVNPTVTTIYSQYWTARYANQVTYTEGNVLLAYYYPVLWEYLNDTNYKGPPVDLTAGIGINGLTTEEEVRNHVLYNFTGLSDPTALAVVQANRPLLNSYRLAHTFRFFNVNKYVPTLESQTQRVSIASPSLNTSLVTLLNGQQSKFFTQALSNYGLTLATYCNAASNFYKVSAVLTDMYRFTQSNFRTVFGVPWNQYSVGYYASANYSLFLQDGSSLANVPSNDQEAAAAKIVTYSNNILQSQNLQTDPPTYWPNIKDLPSPPVAYSNLGASNYVYTVPAETINFNHSLLQPDGQFFTEQLTKSATAVCPVKSGFYTLFAFRSKVRQTLQVETLPRPTAYRVPLYNQTFESPVIQQYFDASYAYVNPAYLPTQSNLDVVYDNIPLQSLLPTPGWMASTSNTFGLSYASSLANWTSSVVIDIRNFQQALFGTFRTPDVPNADPGSNYTFQMNLTASFYVNRQDTIPVQPQQSFQLFLYHDRAAFEADALNLRQESPIFYKVSSLLTTDATSTTLSFRTYPNQQYYYTLRPDTTPFGTVYTRIVPWFSNLSTQSMTRALNEINPAIDTLQSSFQSQITSNFNYAQIYDSNFLRLPIQSTLWSPDPSSDLTTQVGSVSSIALGYDVNDVSTDFTDYIPYTSGSYTGSFTPKNTLAFDPITAYQFQNLSGYNPTTQTYLYTGGANSVFTPNLSNLYTPSTILQRETKLAQYYSLNYIDEPTGQSSITSLLQTDADSVIAQKPYTLQTTHGAIPGYTYDGSNSALQLGIGVLGLSIFPQEGQWDVPRLWFRSAIADSNNDPNATIRTMGIYNMMSLVSTLVPTISLSSAIMVLSNSARVTYTSSSLLSPNNADDFDVKGGTYYEFRKDRSFSNSALQPYLTGATMPPSTIHNQPESIYVAIAFDSNGAPLTIKALSGSAVPYPLYSEPAVSTAYVDGTRPIDGRGVVIPTDTLQTDWPWAIGSWSNYAPVQDKTKAQTAISLPIGVTALPYKIPFPPEKDTIYLQPWTMPQTPTRVLATVSEKLLLEDTFYSIYSYTATQPRILGGTPTVLSPDDLFPSGEQTSLLGVTGNKSAYIFAGLSNIDTVQGILRLKSVDPTTNTVTELPIQPLQLPLQGGFQSLTVSDSGAITICYRNNLTLTTTLYTTENLSSVFTSYVFPGLSNVIHRTDTSSTDIWYAFVNTQGVSEPILYKVQSQSFPGTAYPLTGIPSLTDFSVTSSNRFYGSLDQIACVTLSSPTLFVSQTWGAQIGLVSTGTTLSNVNRVRALTSGSEGDLWLTTDTGVWATRRSASDVNGTLGLGWQIFYPCHKVSLVKVANTFSPITDLTSLHYPEYPHVSMFYYENSNALFADIQTKWGQESSSNFYVGDVRRSGYAFQSYIFNVPVTSNLSSGDFHYLTVRGTTPTETFDTLIRIVAPNQYDYGYATPQNLITEISTSVITPSLFATNYAQSLSSLNSLFTFGPRAFGAGLYPGFPGSNISSIGYSNFFAQYSTFYTQYLVLQNGVSTIQGYVRQNVNQYISTYLFNFLPPDSLLRSSPTDPLLFKIQWETAINPGGGRTGCSPTIGSLKYNWGLGYNLGYDKRDTPFGMVHKGQSFYKILDDYIYLRLNPELRMNMMDTTGEENLSVTRESTGAVQNYYGKLLLNDFNSFSQTMITLPVTLNPPLGKLEQMYFEWTDLTGAKIDNKDCEWSAVLQITESQVTTSAESTLPAQAEMKTPAATPYAP